MEFLRTLEDGIKLVPDLDRLERVEHFKVPRSSCSPDLLIKSSFFLDVYIKFDSHRKCCFPWEAHFFIMPIVSRSTAPSVPATPKSQRSWPKVKPGSTCH